MTEGARRRRAHWHPHFLIPDLPAADARQSPQAVEYAGAVAVDGDGGSVIPLEAAELPGMTGQPSASNVTR